MGKNRLFRLFSGRAVYLGFISPPVCLRRKISLPLCLNINEKNYSPTFIITPPFQLLKMDWAYINDLFMSVMTLLTYIIDQFYSIQYRQGFLKFVSLLKKMGNALRARNWMDPGDIRKKEILESRNRYIDEQFRMDDDFSDLDEVDAPVKNAKGE